MEAAGSTPYLCASFGDELIKKWYNSGIAVIEKIEGGWVWSLSGLAFSLQVGGATMAVNAGRPD